MRATLVVLLAIAAVAAAVVSQDRLDMIAEINSKQTMWRAALNSRFAHQEVGASKSLCGAKPTTPETIAREVAAGRLTIVNNASEGFTAPDSFDSATNWPMCNKTIADIRDQSDCGCCWAFGAAEAASDRLCIETKGQTLLPLSAQNMCFCASFDGCDGGELGQAWSYIKSHGLVTGGQNKGIGPFGSGYCSEFSLPHCHHHGPVRNDPFPAEGTPGCPTVSSSPACPKACDNSAIAPHNNFNTDKFSFSGTVHSYNGEAAIMEAISTGGPVECAFDVYSDFENYAGGVYKHTGGSMLGGHAVKIVGWGVDAGVKYWKVANSWNPYWGENGYFRIVKGENECGIENGVTASASGASWGPKQ